MIKFHGGCTGCTKQKKQPIDLCYDCCYFNSEWDKPDLNNKPETMVDRVRETIIQRRERNTV